MQNWLYFKQWSLIKVWIAESLKQELFFSLWDESRIKTGECEKTLFSPKEKCNKNTQMRKNCDEESFSVQQQHKFKVAYKDKAKKKQKQRAPLWLTKKKKKNLNSVRTLARLLVFTEHWAEVQGAGGMHIVGTTLPTTGRATAGGRPVEALKASTHLLLCWGECNNTPAVFQNVWPHASSQTTQRYKTCITLTGKGRKKKPPSL